MNSHKHARLTAAGRALLVSMHHAGSCFELNARQPAGQVSCCAVLSISRGWGSTGTWTAPRCRRLPRPCGNLLGQVRLRVSPAPAVLAAVLPVQ